MTDTPGRLLSSLSNADGKPPKVGGCVGVFFQLFDWNRRLSGKHLFSNKSLPAERPQSNKFNDEKLPMAKLLLIADENRGLFPRNSSSETQSEVGSERSFSDNGSNKKPGVVARLMGLESFPEPELPAHHQTKRSSPSTSSSPQKKIPSMYRYQELQMLEDLLQGQQEDLRRLTPSSSRKEMLHSKESSLSNTKPLREEKMPKNTKKLQDPMDKVPLSPKKSSFASMLSPSKSGKMITPTPPIKSQSRKTNILMGAAARILDQPSRARALLDKPAGDQKSSGGFHGDLKRSLPRGGKQAQKENPKGSSGVVKGSTSLFQGRPGVKPGNPNSGFKVKQAKVDEVKAEDQASVSEHDDESLSVECDSQASSSKENRNNSAKPPRIVPKLSRSGSVKEEQPPTPPSRGSLFRSKSVREEAPSPQPLQPSAPQQALVPEKTSGSSQGGKEVRLKREKRHNRVSSPEPAPKPETGKRKPALDQGRAASRGESQPKTKASVTPKRGAPEQQQKKNGGILSYDRIFGGRKQAKSPSPSKEAPIIQAEKKSEELEPESESKAQKNESSLMKSLLRRKSLSKAETVSSSKKKVVEKSSKPRSIQAFERQKRMGGASPVREPKGSPRVMPQESFEEEKMIESPKLDDPVLDVSPEKIGAPERVYFEAEKITDKSLEEILKTILSKSLGRTGLGDSPLGKECKTPAPDENSDDPNVIDMDVSPLETEPDHQLDELPCKVLQFEEDEDDDQRQATTPLALPLDTSDSTKEVMIAGEDGGQPSPVSVLDFSALQSPFPSEATTSCEEIDEDGKQVLESDAESFLASKPVESEPSCRLDFELPEPEIPEDATSYEGQEIDLYVRDVLMRTGFDHPQEAAIPCTEEIFHRLEKQRSSQGDSIEFPGAADDDHRKFEAPGSCHRLMYECIAEALNLVLDPFRDENHRAMASSCLRRRPVGEDLVAEVSGFILGWREMTLGMVDDLVEVDMSSAAGKWRESREESLEIGSELERMIFRSMMEDLISDLVGLRIRRRAGIESLELLH